MKKEKLLELFASVASIVGVFTIALGYPFEGFFFSLTASISYALYAYITGQYFFMVASIVYAVADVVGIIHWKQGV